MGRELHTKPADSSQQLYTGSLQAVQTRCSMKHVRKTMQDQQHKPPRMPCALQLRPHNILFLSRGVPLIGWPHKT
jgi:hypothetical protein